MSGKDNPRFKLRSSSAPVRCLPPPAPSPSLSEALEAAAIDALVGSLADASAVGRVLTAVRAALLQRGLGEARVQAELVGAGVRVSIDLPPSGPQVRRLVLNLQ
jgi:hypothetical protein